MGDRTRSLRSSGLRLLLRLLSVVAALFVLSVSSQASAATNVPVPMCGDHNESVAAPPIFRGARADYLRALPCHAPDQLGSGPSAPMAPERVIVHERPERVLGFGSLRVAHSESSRVSIASASRAVKRPGFVGTLFRPPCE